MFKAERTLRTVRLHEEECDSFVAELRGAARMFAMLNPDADPALAIAKMLLYISRRNWGYSLQAFVVRRFEPDGGPQTPEAANDGIIHTALRHSLMTTRPAS